MVDILVKTFELVEKDVEEVEKVRKGCTDSDEKIERHLLGWNALASCDLGDFRIAQNLAVRSAEALATASLLEAPVTGASFESAMRFEEMCTLYT